MLRTNLLIMNNIKTSLILYLGIIMLLLSCKKDEFTDKNPTVYKTDQAYKIMDVSYGDQPAQTMDIYLPQNRSSDSTKVIVLIHGGGWAAGSKEGMTNYFTNLSTWLPNYAIININYRLGTLQEPGYPKQINDIKQALSFIESGKFNVNNSYFLIGVSAGAHLSLLYGYKYDNNHEVKGICNTVGPTNFTDTTFQAYPATQNYIQYFVGPYSLEEKPLLYKESSPVFSITTSSPKTISFYGNTDPLVPLTQLQILNYKLDSVGVYHESTVYNGGHANWSTLDYNDYGTKLVNFIHYCFNEF